MSSVPDIGNRAAQQRREALSRQLLAIVEPLVDAGESYGDLSVERLIQAADISRSTFYSYFDDKGDLLGAMAAGVAEDLSAAGAAWWALRAEAGFAGLREALRSVFETYRGHQVIFASIVELAPQDARVHEQHQRLVDVTVGQLREHLVAWQRAGTAAPDLDPERTAQWLVWMFEHGLYQLVRPAGDEEVERLLDALTGIVWRVLYEGFRPR